MKAYIAALLIGCLVSAAGMVAGALLLFAAGYYFFGS